MSSAEDPLQGLVTELRELLEAGGNPNAGPGTSQSDPSVDREVMAATVNLQKACKNAQREFALIYNHLRPLRQSNPMHDKLHELLLVLQEAYKILGELHTAAQTDAQPSGPPTR